MKTFYRVMSIAVVMWVAKTVAERVRSSHAAKNHNRKIDTMLEESFPSSDAPSSWAGSAG